MHKHLCNKQLKTYLFYCIQSEKETFDLLQFLWCFQTKIKLKLTPICNFLPKTTSLLMAILKRWSPLLTRFLSLTTSVRENNTMFNTMFFKSCNEISICYRNIFLRVDRTSEPVRSICFFIFGYINLNVMKHWQFVF